MTELPGWKVTRTRELPADPRLRKAAEEARAAGKAWTCIVASPSPALGRTGRRPRETLIVGHRAARVRLGVVQWGRWDSEHEVVHLDRGLAVDLAGRKAAVPVDLAPIPPGADPTPPWRAPRWLVGATLLVGLALVVLSYGFPFHLTMTYRWVVLLALGPPLMFATEWLLDLAAPPAGRQDDARIGYADRVVLLLIVLVILLVPVMWWSLAHRG